MCLLVSQPPSQQRPCQRWAVLICLSPLQTVTAGEATGLAKPLPKQGVKKGKVWAIFIGGAVSIFATTVLLENNERLFPAIKKANVASQMARQRMQVRLRSAVCCTAASELCSTHRPRFQGQQPIQADVQLSSGSCISSTALQLTSVF